MKGKASEIRSAVLQDGKLWYFYREYRYLFSMDVETGEIRSYEIPIAKKSIYKNAFSSIALVGRKLYLVPLLDNVIMKFDMDLEQFEKIDLDEQYIRGNDRLFFSVGKNGQYLFVMGLTIPVILRVDTVNDHIDYITDWYQQVENLIFDTTDIYFRRQCVVVNDKLFVPFCNANAILELNCISMETVVHALGEKKQGYSGICLEEDSLWLSPRKNGDVIKWNITTKQKDVITSSELRTTREDYWYAGIVVNNYQKMLFPARKKKTVRIESKNVEEVCGVFDFVEDNGTYILFSEENSGVITVIDRGSGRQFNLNPGNVDVDITGILRGSDNFIVENATIGIRNFIKHVSTKM